MPELQAGIWPPVEAVPPQPIPPLNHSGIPTNQAKLSSIGKLTFTEVGDPPYGYKEHFAEGDIKATRHFDVPWSQRLQFVQYVLGYSTVTGGPMPDGKGGIVRTTPQLRRQIPWQHPQLPHLYAERCELVLPQGATADDPNVVAVDANNQPVLTAQLGAVWQQGADPESLAGETILKAGVQIPAGFPDPPADLNKQVVQRLPMIRYYDSSTGNDGMARYAVTYGVRPYDVRDDDEIEAKWSKTGQAPELARWVEREYAYAASNLPLPAGVLVFAEGPFKGQPIGQLGSVLILGTMTAKYTWSDVPDLPRDSIRVAIGRINEADFDGLPGYDLFPAGTLLCLAPSSRQRYRSSTGRILWRISYQFIFREQGWNNFVASDGKFYPVENKTSGIAPYLTWGFESLFTPPDPVIYQ